MIHVDRGDPPPILDEKNREAKGPKERQRACACFESGDAEAKIKFEFSVYKDSQVQDALHRLFHGKCAYCETFYASSQPLDVEHYRPKGAWENDQGKLVPPGYYWLAADWTNLLPSDIDCNRRRRQRIAGTEIVLNQGKANQFPLEPGSPRAARQGEEANEKPLLLDPSRDYPEKSFYFDVNAVILPKQIGPDQPDPRAQASIEVYALNRSDLVLARRERLLIIQQHIFIIRQLSLVLANPQLGQEVHDLVEDLLAYEFDTLEGYKKPDRPYALMARQVIDNFLAEFPHT